MTVVAAGLHRGATVEEVAEGQVIQRTKTGPDGVAVFERKLSPGSVVIAQVGGIDLKGRVGEGGLTEPITPVSTVLFNSPQPHQEALAQALHRAGMEVTAEDLLAPADGLGRSAAAAMRKDVVAARANMALLLLLKEYQLRGRGAEPVGVPEIAASAPSLYLVVGKVQRVTSEALFREAASRQESLAPTLPVPLRIQVGDVLQGALATLLDEIKMTAGGYAGIYPDEESLRVTALQASLVEYAARLGTIEGEPRTEPVRRHFGVSPGAMIEVVESQIVATGEEGSDTVDLPPRLAPERQ